MLGIEKAEQQRHGDGLGSCVPNLSDQPFDGSVRERHDNLPVGADALLDLEPAMPRHQRRRRILKKVVEIGAGGAAQLEDVAESGCGDHYGAGTLFLEECVGYHGGRVGQKRDVRRPDAIALDRRIECGEHAAGEVPGCGESLGGTNPPAIVIDDRHVGEGAADIDTDTPPHGSGTPSSGTSLRMIVAFGRCSWMRGGANEIARNVKSSP